uniref:Retrotransposon gag domain-containing protein n=1 Tax=Amphimedon queenslandica TaxID=400682 RepID=A0A1X7TYL0_AMPQE
MALIKDGLWGIVSGTETIPEVAGARAKFESRRDKAIAIIILSIEPSLLYLLGENPDDPVKVWKALQDQFQRESWANKLSLRRKLYSLKLREQDSVQDHIKSMIEIFNELSIVGDAISEEDQVVHLLASLPDYFGVLVTAPESNSEVPKMQLVTERLLGN